MDNEHTMPDKENCPVCNAPVASEEKEVHAKEHEDAAAREEPQGGETTIETTAAGLGGGMNPNAPAPGAPAPTPQTPPQPTVPPAPEPQTPPQPTVPPAPEPQTPPQQPAPGTPGEETPPQAPNV